MDPFCGHAPAIHSELAQLRKTRQSMQTVSIAVAVVGAGWVATRLSFILIPLLLAYLVTFMLSPLLDLLESKPLVWGARVRMVPRPAALLATILAAFAALAATFVVARSSWDQFECSRGLERLAEVDRNASSWLAARGFRAVGNSSLLMGNAEQAGSLDMAELQSALGWLSEAANSAVTILLLAVYLILEREQGQWQQQAPDARHDRAYMQRGKGKAFKGSGESAQQMEALLRFYVELKTSISFVTGLLVGITLYCFGVPLSPVFALSAFACNFVPNIGSFVSILLPVPVVLIQPACTPATCVGCACLSASGKALAIALPSALQLYVVNFLEPLLFGQSLNLTPFSVLASLVFWALLWGLPGAVLSTPLLGAMKIALSTSRHAVARYVLSLIRKYDIDDQSQLALERSRVLQRLSLKNQFRRIWFGKTQSRKGAHSSVALPKTVRSAITPDSVVAQFDKLPDANAGSKTALSTGSALAIGDEQRMMRQCQQNLKDHRWPAITRRPLRALTDATATEDESPGRLIERFSFSVLQYDVLAEGLCLPPSCAGLTEVPPDCLGWQLRKWRLLETVLVESPDVICLQRLDHFHDWMEPQLRKAGYAGRFYETPNSPCKQFRDDLADGVAIFWRTSKFRLIELCEAGYHAAGRSDSSSVALIARLRLRLDDLIPSPPAQDVVFATTEFSALGGELGDSNRLSQMKQLLGWCTNEASRDARRGGRDAKPLPVVICGSLHAEPASEPLQCALRHSLRLADGAEDLPFTRWSRVKGVEVRECADHCLFSRELLGLTAVLDAPEGVGATRLPSHAHPSDHIPVLSRFQVR